MEIGSRLESGEGEHVDELIERHPILEPFRNRDGKAGQDSPQRGALFGQVDEDLAESPVLVFAGPQEHLVAANASLLGEASSPGRQEETRRLHAAGVSLGGGHSRRDAAPSEGLLLGQSGIDVLGLFLVVALIGRRRRQGLGGFRTISVESHRLQPQIGREHVGPLDVFGGHFVGHVDGLRDRS